MTNDLSDPASHDTNGDKRQVNDEIRFESNELGTISATAGNKIEVNQEVSDGGDIVGEIKVDDGTRNDNKDDNDMFVNTESLLHDKENEGVTKEINETAETEEHNEMEDQKETSNFTEAPLSNIRTIATIPTESEIEQSIAFENQHLEMKDIDYQSNDIVPDMNEMANAGMKIDDFHLKQNDVLGNPMMQQEGASMASLAMPATEPSETNINARDVLCGRGGGTNNHPGNRHFREVVAAYQPQYIACKKSGKKFISAKVVEIIRQLGGRFLQRVHDSQWIDIGDKKAIEKTSQALREGMDVRHKKAQEGGQEGDAYNPQHQMTENYTQANMEQPQHRSEETMQTTESNPVSAAVADLAAQAIPQDTPFDYSPEEPYELPPPPHLCILCGGPENQTRSLCFFPPDLLMHAFCGTLAASPTYNKPQYELLHMKGIKHKYRQDDACLKLLPAALSRTRSAVNKANQTRLYMIRDLEYHIKELKELQMENDIRVVHPVHSVRVGKRGRGRPRKGEIVVPQAKRPRGRPPKDSEKLS